MITKQKLAGRGIVCVFTICCLGSVLSSWTKAAPTNPEDFERFNVGDKLTIAEGWSGNSNGTSQPVANDITSGANQRFAQIVSINGADGNPTKALEMHTDTYNNNMELWWQRTITSLGGSPTQVVFSFDALMQDNVQGVPERVMANASNLEFFWANNDPGDGPPGTVNMYIQPVSHILSPPNLALNTWYHWDVLLDLTNNTVSPRYGLTGQPMPAYSVSYTAGSSNHLIDPSVPIRIFSNDTVYWDNLALTAVPEPSTVVLAALGFLSLYSVRRKCVSS